MAQLPDLLDGHHLGLVGIHPPGDLLLEPVHYLAESLRHQRVGSQLPEQPGIAI
jgi:hypothetical protein